MNKKLATVGATIIIGTFLAILLGGGGVIVWSFLRAGCMLFLGCR